MREESKIPFFFFYFLRLSLFLPISLIGNEKETLVSPIIHIKHGSIVSFMVSNYCRGVVTL